MFRRNLQNLRPEIQISQSNKNKKINELSIVKKYLLNRSKILQNKITQNTILKNTENLNFSNKNKLENQIKKLKNILSFYENEIIFIEQQIEFYKNNNQPINHNIYAIGVKKSKK